MSNRDQILLLEDMLESALKIKRYTAKLDYDSFLADEKTIDAVVRNFEIIGEAANRIDSHF
ncbi:MAG TPA: HepT-like ribonuclease domain-containing protein [Bacteroidales bacterium]